MNNHIRQLDQSIVGLIAAGEVVERPALAIKELVENSIDAGATAISVDIREGGLTQFRVTDNGCGIRKDELLMAFRRNATSKLDSAEGLDAIQTLGFRGEALASIAAVARVTCASRARGEPDGASIRIEGGQVIEISDAAVSEGTSVTVRDLFFNTPARRKFMKKPSVEAAYIAEWMARLMLSRPDIASRFTSDGRLVMRTPGASNGKSGMDPLLAAVSAVWGRTLSDGMTRFSGSAAGCSARGLIGVGELACGDRSRQMVFMNGRYVHAKSVANAIDEATRERVMIGSYPSFIVYMEVAFSQIDINVHPNKTEVRLRNEREVCEGIRGIISDALSNMNRVAIAPDTHEPATHGPHTEIHTEISTIEGTPRSDATGQGNAEEYGDAPKLIHSARDSSLAFMDVAMEAANEVAEKVIKDVTSEVIKDVLKEEKEDTPEVKPKPAEQQSMLSDFPGAGHKTNYHIIGSAFSQYIIVQHNDALYLIDQHAAHERYLYDRYMAATDSAAVTQRLIEPVVIHLTGPQAMLVQAYADMLAAGGAEFEVFGENAIRVHSAPVVLGEPALDLVRNMVASLSGLNELPIHKRRRDELLKLACKKAIKGGETLSPEQVESLLNEVARGGTGMPTCPHGRPICVEISKKELDKRFGRT